MKNLNIWIIPVCIISLSVGQVLFKKVAVNYNRLGTFYNIEVIGILVVAGLLYVISTGLWLWVLRFVDISKAYPYFALGFVLVPLLGAWMFGEVLNIRYILGVLLIVVGVAMTSSS